jgi:hypothetical protein
MEMEPSTTFFGSHAAISQPNSTYKPILNLKHYGTSLGSKIIQNGVNIQNCGIFQFFSIYF